MTEQEFEAILRQAMQPEILPEETVVRGMRSGKGNIINMKKILKKACFAAALMALLTTTVYAAEVLDIKTLVSNGGSRMYKTVQQAEEKAGFEMDDLEKFSNGYGVTGARVGETQALDENDKVQFVYNQIDVRLKNAAGEKLYLVAYESKEGIEESDTVPDLTRKLGDVILNYRQHHYKFVPADYELTDSDRTMMQKPGYYISYGSESIEENDMAFLNWEKDGICYTLMDSDGSETAESLFAMAEELILSGK